MAGFFICTGPDEDPNVTLGPCSAAVIGPHAEMAAAATVTYCKLKCDPLTHHIRYAYPNETDHVFWGPKSMHGRRCNPPH